MATWTKTNNVITLTQDTTMSELVNDSDIPLVDADTIQLKGHNLIVDIITCGSADPDYNDEVNIGVTVKNDGGGECNLEFKDLSGIRLNATLPVTVYPWVDPDNPLPVITKDPRKVIHGDPYCTKLTANARAEIQLAGNFSLGGGSASLQTITRSDKWYSNIVTWPSNTECELEDILNVHKNDMFGIICGGDNAGFYRITNIQSKTITISESPLGNYRPTSGVCCIMGGGFMIKGLHNNTTPMINQNINFGALSILKNASNGNSIFTNAIIIGDRLIGMPHVNGRTWAKSLCQGISCAIINDIATPCLKGENIGGSKIKVIAKNILTTYNMGTGDCQNDIIADYFVGCSFIFGTNTTVRVHSKVITSNGIGMDRGTMDKYSFIHGENWAYYNNRNVYQISTGTVQFYEDKKAWQHKPTNATYTTWRYTDRLIPPHKYLFLRIFRLVESASQNSEARVAITDTANWYPETKFGALADIVIRDIETDKWQTYSLKWRNDSDEPQQVRVWECASGSTDGGYLRVEEATGGPM